MRNYWVTVDGAIVPESVTVRDKGGGEGMCMLRHTCRACSGTGYKILKGICQECEGKGHEHLRETLVFNRHFTGHQVLLSSSSTESPVFSDWMTSNVDFIEWLNLASGNNEFLKSLRKRLSGGHYLSERQLEVALKIWSEKKSV